MDLEFQKTLPKQAGVYSITNTINNKIYVGSTIDLNSRYRTHFYMLSIQRHGNTHLQRAYDLYGFEAFKFEILELVSEDSDLLNREQFYLDFYRKEIKYNILATAGSNLGVEFSEEHKTKLSESNRVKYHGLPTGVTYDTTNENFVARIRYKGGRYTLGHFLTPEESCNELTKFKENPEDYIKKLELKKLKKKLLIDTKPIGVFFNKALGGSVARVEQVIDVKN
jgi:group I intron endonuclease